MAAPQFIEEKGVSIADVKTIMASIEKRDTEMNFRSNKTKEFLENFAADVDAKKNEELKEKLLGLGLTRLREEHVSKIVDFLPKTADDLKVVLQAYPLSMPKKDMDAIVDAVKAVMG